MGRTTKECFLQQYHDVNTRKLQVQLSAHCCCKCIKKPTWRRGGTESLLWATKNPRPREGRLFTLDTPGFTRIRNCMISSHPGPICYILLSAPTSNHILGVDVTLRDAACSKKPCYFMYLFKNLRWKSFLIVSLINRLVTLGSPLA